MFVLVLLLNLGFLARPSSGNITGDVLLSSGTASRVASLRQSASASGSVGNERDDARLLGSRRAAGGAGPGGPPAPAFPTTAVPLATPPLSVLGAAAPARGIFDPSTQFTGVAASPLLMSYSAVAATNDISTQLAAYSVAAGSWLHVSAVNAAAVNSSQPCGSGGGGGASCVASLVHEVSSLVIEADGTLRVLCHSYLVINGSDLR